MAGDLAIHESVTIEASALGGAEAFDLQAGRAVHRYGRVVVRTTSPRASDPRFEAAPVEDQELDLDLVESMGLEAFRLRDSEAYRAEKVERPRDGDEWDMVEGCASAPEAESFLEDSRASNPTSAALTGSVAVGIVIVNGPTTDSSLTETEQLKAVAEVQNGLSFLANANPDVGLSFSYDIQVVNLDGRPDPDADDLEAQWRDPAMNRLGHTGNFQGVRDYVEEIRNRFGTRWGYCAFFTRYPVGHFAYASIGGPRLVMHFENGSWGPDNIDRVFAHETGHIFGAPDEYAQSKCTCGGSWGTFGITNGNCANCAADSGVKCLMRRNSWEFCGYTQSHLGWGPQLVVKNYGAGAGGWQIERHPRVLGDTNGDGRSDIIGFGNAGVFVSRSKPFGGFETPDLVVGNFGYNAGGWRVERHPRLVADVTGDGRCDIVGFGNDGAWISYAQDDGSFAAPRLVVSSYGYNAGGWRVENHPRFLADTTGDGKLDIIGLGNAGVYVSRWQVDGTFTDPKLVVNNFGYNAGGWRIERHPRFVVDVTGNGRADVVGFGNDGVWVSFAQSDGSFTDPKLVVNNFGYNAGGWRVERHPRFVVDVTGNGRADVVGFGNDGVWVSFAQSDGSFTDPKLVVNNFGYNAGGWRVAEHPRLLADTTGDGKADIVGFGNAGVYVSRMLGDNTFEDPGLLIKNFARDAGGWQVDRHPRVLGDVTGDGRADIVGFGNNGVYTFRF